jgi:hypothetical protein
VKVLVVEEADLALRSVEVVHLHAPHQQRAVEVHHVAALQPHFQLIVRENGPRRQRVGLVRQVRVPALVGPEEAALAAILLLLARRHGRPHAESARTTAQVILLPDVRVVEITDLVVLIKADQHLPVAHRDVTRHTRYPWSTTDQMIGTSRSLRSGTPTV